MSITKDLETCSNCGEETENEPLCLCDECDVKDGPTWTTLRSAIDAVKDTIHGKNVVYIDHLYSVLGMERK